MPYRQDVDMASDQHDQGKQIDLASIKIKLLTAMLDHAVMDMGCERRLAYAGTWIGIEVRLDFGLDSTVLYRHHGQIEP